MKATMVLGLLTLLLWSGTIALAQEERPVIYVPRRGGGELFVYCVTCHKADGRGGPSEGGNAANLRITQLTAHEIVMVITDGRLEKGMPAFGPILDQQKIMALAKFIKEELKEEYRAEK